MAASVANLGPRSLNVCRAGGPGQHLPFFWQFEHVGQVSSCPLLELSICGLRDRMTYHILPPVSSVEKGVPLVLLTDLTFTTYQTASTFWDANHIG
jgi:hypothetical protein